MKQFLKIPLFLSFFLIVAGFVSGQALTPKVDREFRGLWVASVGNSNWPSKRGLPVDQQKAELISILDRAVKLHLNAVILQVRPACDALYFSQLEPWSEYLTGEMGKAPAPYYDPLAFAVAEAHKRGLELHAWFNPYRARVAGSKTVVSPNHITKKHPEWVRSYGKYLWLDPAEKGVQDQAIAVISDVVKRYDLDGVHMDDYFYPYPEDTKDKKKIVFDDEKTWKQYQASGGKPARNDWRRENVNVFVARLYKTVKAQKPWVKVGISPFGIWKPGAPPSVKGLNAYEELYADSRKWLASGWVDYLAPQLYWAIGAPEQSFPALLKWWTEQNVKQRHIWPGSSMSNVGKKWGAEEIINQIKITRNQREADGNILWSMNVLFKNTGGLADQVEQIYAVPALVPACPWVSKAAPTKPKLMAKMEGSNLKLNWSSTEKSWLWLLQKQSGNQWTTEILPGEVTVRSLPKDGSLQTVVLTAVNRYGNESVSEVMSFKK